jgi:hypothetical protein
MLVAWAGRPRVNYKLHQVDPCIDGGRTLHLTQPLSAGLPVTITDDREGAALVVSGNNSQMGE